MKTRKITKKDFMDSDQPGSFLRPTQPGAKPTPITNPFPNRPPPVLRPNPFKPNPGKPIPPKPGRPNPSNPSNPIKPTPRPIPAKPKPFTNLGFTNSQTLKPAMSNSTMTVPNQNVPFQFKPAQTSAAVNQQYFQSRVANNQNNLPQNQFGRINSNSFSMNQNPSFKPYPTPDATIQPYPTPDATIQPYPTPDATIQPYPEISNMGNTNKRLKKTKHIPKKRQLKKGIGYSSWQPMFEGTGKQPSIPSTINSIMRSNKYADD